MKITLNGEPRSTNHIYKSHARFGHPVVYMSKEGKELKEGYIWEAKSQFKGTPLICPVELKIDLYFGRKGKHDIDNYNKILLDSLTGIAYEDDSQIERLHIRKFYDKENPRIEIEVL